MTITKKNFILQKIGEEYMVIPVGNASEQFKGTLILNESAALYWKEVEKGTTVEGLVTVAMDQFDDIDEDTVREDIKGFLEEISFATENVETIRKEKVQCLQ